MKVGDLVISKSCGELGLIIDRYMTPSDRWLHVVLYCWGWTLPGGATWEFYDSELEVVCESR